MIRLRSRVGALAAGALAVMLVAAACGGGDTEVETAADTTAPMAAADTTAPMADDDMEMDGHDHAGSGDDEHMDDDEAAHDDGSDHDDDDGHDHDDEDAASLGVSGADQVIELGVTGGRVDGPQSVEVDAGSTVALVVTADVADEVHVHGYDLYVDLIPGEIATLMFEANIPGQFEVELEGSSLLLTELEVS